MKFGLPDGLPKSNIGDIVKTGIGAVGDIASRIPQTIVEAGPSVFPDGKIPVSTNDSGFKPVAQNDPELDRIYTKLDEVRTEEWGPKFDDLSKADQTDIDREIEKMKEDGTYGNGDYMYEDPETPGVTYQQVGEFVETTITLYDGLAFNELPEQDQLDVLEYEQNKKDIENSSLSDQEKAAAIADLDLPECMENMSEEKRYQKGNVKDIVGDQEPMGNKTGSEEQITDEPIQEAESNIEYSNDGQLSDGKEVLATETFEGPGYSGVKQTIKAPESVLQEEYEEWLRQQEEIQNQ